MKAVFINLPECLVAKVVVPCPIIYQCYNSAIWKTTTVGRRVEKRTAM